MGAYKQVKKIKKDTVPPIRVIVLNPPTTKHKEKKLKELAAFLSKELSKRKK